MNGIVSTLKILFVSLLGISIAYLIYSLPVPKGLSINQGTLDAIFQAIQKYSGLYEFTFIVGAFWATLTQLKITLDSYSDSLKQMRLTQEEIIFNRSKDLKSETLKQCDLYLVDMQLEYRNLIETGMMSGSPVYWRNLNSICRESLEKNYPNIYKHFNSAEKASKNQALVTLYRLESFSSFIQHGILDKDLAWKIIGLTFVKQVGFLIGLIAYYRPNEDIFINVLSLYNEWSIRLASEYKNNAAIVD